jgi:hypothetical protein
MGHRYLQGYVFSRPLEASQLTDGEWRACVDPSAGAPVAPAAQFPALPS